MVDKWKVGDIGVQGGVTNGVTKLKWIKFSENFKQKIFKILWYTLQHKPIYNP